ncbi:uncharacterized protein LOC101846752 [Aplysia californica]|uniref:Uncharacterized protein LOC101846752 n=1 Tax=Aplysia californica TaxID=6500 RepID=A0ABM1A5D0_APLCA|nr:uncharacterized protein LOC101846752 [Aplysia californica]XP_012941139.1 uncharacterized protein LOC101846752 [Aplysia californica]XP_035827106.1 uncharacterized protein LOC101846752 [Aplysia californica]
MEIEEENKDPAIGKDGPENGRGFEGVGGAHGSSCVQQLMVKLRIVKGDATPVNWKYIMMVVLALFSSSSTLTFLFPFLPEMIMSFGYSEEDKGKYGGYVAGCVFAGRVFGSVFWGWLADRRGRKLVLLITIALNGLFAFLFGFAKNLGLAMFFRFMCGAVNGTVGTSKAILYDISDNSNQAIGMAFLSIAWALGLIIGPLMGGVLASPAVKYPSVFDADGIFGEFPYLLTTLFPLITCILIFLFILVKFDETFVSEVKRKKTTVVYVEKEEEDNPSLKKEAGDCSEWTILHAKDAWTSQSSMHNLGQSIQSFSLEAEPLGLLALQMGRKEQSYEPDTSLPVRRQHMQSQPNLSVDVTADLKDEFVSQKLPSQYSKSTPNVFDLEYEKASLKQIFEGVNSSTNEGQLDWSVTTTNPRVRNGYNDGQNPNGCVKTADIESNPWRSKTSGVAQSTGINGDVNGKDDPVAAEKGDRSRQVLLQVSEEREESVCSCMVWCCRTPCCRPASGSSLAKLLLYTDVWAAIMLYTVLSFTTIGVEDIFPVFASTRKDLGGLGFSTDEIGVAIGTMTIPLLVLQLKLFPFLEEKMGVRRVTMLSCVVCLVTCQMLPLVRLLSDNPIWLWFCLFLIQLPNKIAVNSCFAGSALLINNCAAQELAGQVNGLAMMSTAIGRSVAPVFAGGLFTWTVTYGPGIGFPFDTSFPFFVLGMIYIITVFECLHINARLDKQKK